MDITNEQIKDLFIQKLKEAKKEFQHEYDFDSDCSELSLQDIEVQQNQVQQDVANNNEKKEEEEIEKQEQQKQQDKQCIICKEKKGKYTCPACQRKTCSLNCSKQHKQDFKCDGVYRQQKQFIRKSDFTENDVRKDFNYLENTIQDTENIMKKMNHAIKAPELLRFKLLKSQLYKKFNASWQFAPSIMSRHRENISFYYVKTKMVYLNVEFKYFYPKAGEEKLEQIRYLLDPQSEGVILRDMILTAEFQNKDLLTNESIDLSNPNFKKLVDEDKICFYIQNIYKTNELRRIREENPDHEYRHWFDINEIPENALVKIDLNRPLAYYLKYLRIKEFPTFFFVLKEHEEQLIERFAKFIKPIQQYQKQKQNRGDFIGASDDSDYDEEKDLQQQLEKQKEKGVDIMEYLNQKKEVKLSDLDNITDSRLQENLKQEIIQEKNKEQNSEGKSDLQKMQEQFYEQIYGNK